MGKKRRVRYRRHQPNRPSGSITLPETGDPCPRCSQATIVRAHTAITEKQLRKAYYYSRWFICENPQCPTTMIMPEEFKVVRDAPAAPKRVYIDSEAQNRLDAIMAQLGEDVDPPWL